MQNEMVFNGQTSANSTNTSTAHKTTSLWEDCVHVLQSFRNDNDNQNAQHVNPSSFLQMHAFGPSNSLALESAAALAARRVEETPNIGTVPAEHPSVPIPDVNSGSSNLHGCYSAASAALLAEEDLWSLEDKYDNSDTETSVSPARKRERTGKQTSRCTRPRTEAPVDVVDLTSTDDENDSKPAAVATAQTPATKDSLFQDSAEEDDDIELLEQPPPNALVADTYQSISGIQKLDQDELDQSDGEDVVVVGTKNAVTLPHMRQHCTVHLFCGDQSDPDRTNRNQEFCHLCYCYVCDAPVKDCKSWDQSDEGATRNDKLWLHCNATDRGEDATLWKGARQSVKESLSLQSPLVWKGTLANGKIFWAIFKTLMHNGVKSILWECDSKRGLHFVVQPLGLKSMMIAVNLAPTMFSAFEFFDHKSLRGGKYHSMRCPVPFVWAALKDLTRKTDVLKLSASLNALEITIIRDGHPLICTRVPLIPRNCEDCILQEPAFPERPIQSTMQLMSLKRPVAHFSRLGYQKCRVRMASDHVQLGCDASHRINTHTGDMVCDSDTSSIVYDTERVIWMTSTFARLAGLKPFDLELPLDYFKNSLKYFNHFDPEVRLAANTDGWLRLQSAMGDQTLSSYCRFWLVGEPVAPALRK
jgi:hypothetical protein